MPKMLRLGHCRVASPAEEADAVIHAISLIPKASMGSFRMIHDLTCGLLDADGVERISFNESTPDQFLPRTVLTRSLRCCAWWIGWVLGLGPVVLG